MDEILKTVVEQAPAVTVLVWLVLRMDNRIEKLVNTMCDLTMEMAEFRRTVAETVHRD